MKCPYCKGNMKIVESTIKRDGIIFESSQCESCGEELMDMHQLRKLAIKYRKLRKAKEVKFAKWGNSLAVRIPSDVAEEFKLKAGKTGLMTKEKEGIKIIPTT